VGLQAINVEEEGKLTIGGEGLPGSLFPKLQRLKPTAAALPAGSAPSPAVLDILVMGMVARIGPGERILPPICEQSLGEDCH
jgi:hypothetical protein